MAEEIKNEAMDAKAAKKGKKKLPIILGVVAVVVVAAGAGFWVWHEQPSFCNAICHTPMDAYYETYAEGTQDKWGNELDETQRESMLAYKHGSYPGDATVTCMECHVPTLSEQITEGIAWISGGYEILGTNALDQAVLPERELADLVEARGIEEDAFCMTEECHVGVTRETLVEKTADLSETHNPHMAQHGEYACSDCHKAHAQSVNKCTQCHTEAPVPEGWLSAAEADVAASNVA